MQNALLIFNYRKFNYLNSKVFVVLFRFKLIKYRPVPIVTFNFLLFNLMYFIEFKFISLQ